jgi:hypothetical protein
MLGYLLAHKEHRIQCFDCGSHKTYLVSWTSGSGGGKFKGAVKTWSYHCCSDCDAKMTTDIKIVKD